MTADTFGNSALEYKVSSLGNGEGCMVSFATSCASGNCADGVCCDSACAGTCASCNLVGRAGQCTPYPAGTDPQNECGVGTGVCKSTCDGVDSCAFPQTTVSCGNCYTCDGMGTCSNYDYYCGIYGGAGGSHYPDGGVGGAGGSYYPDGGFPIDVPRYPEVGFLGPDGRSTSNGGSDGSIPNSGGAGGISTIGRGGAGGSIGIDGGILPSLGGSDGSVPSFGGSDGGGIPNLGGSGGSIPSFGGSGGSVLGFGGTGGNRDGGAGDAGTSANLHKSGCGCEVGQAKPGDAGLTTPLLIVGVALLLARKRRRTTCQYPLR